MIYATLDGLQDIISYLRKFYTEHLNKYELLVALLFVAGFTYLRYETDCITQPWRDTYYSYSHVLFYVALYGIPLVFGYLSSAFFHKDWKILSDVRFWVLVALALVSFAFRSTTHLHFKEVFVALNNAEHPRWIASVVGTIIRGLSLIIPLALYWYFFDRNQALYGFTLKGFKTRPYFAMLLIMLPLVLLASTQADFLGTYPRGQRFLTLNLNQMEHWKFYGLYELVYGLDFITIEFFFRGFLVLAFVGIAGPRAILPMALMYMTIHWNKPAGEMISSFFGGSLLGIISYYSRSIVGGIIVHMGLAWLMEIGALFGHFFKS